MNKKGFTLIEMLAVVIILGVIMVVALPSVSKLINKNRMKNYETYLDVLDEKMKVFIDKYKGELSFSTTDSDNNKTSISCYQIKYQDLLKNDFIIESDVKCSGNIYLKKENGNITADYSNLACTDKNGDSYNTASAAQKCVEFSIN